MSVFQGLMDQLSFTAEAARRQFIMASRGNQFKFKLNYNEKSMMADRPWDLSRGFGERDMMTLAQLAVKGLIETSPATGLMPHLPPNQVPLVRLSEAGKLLRQLLIIGDHIQPDPTVQIRPNDIINFLFHSAQLHAATLVNTHNVRHYVELRTVNGETQLVVRIQEEHGAYSEWALTRSNIARIG